MSKDEKTIEFLRTLLTMSEDMWETVQLMGDEDTRNYVRADVDRMKEAIDNFIADNYTAQTPATKEEKAYLRNESRLAYINEQFHLGKFGGRKLEENEQTQLWKARFYNKLVELIKTDENIMQYTTPQELHSYIEDRWVPLTVGNKYWDAKETLNPGEDVMFDVIRYILDQRKKAPQAKLF